MKLPGRRTIRPYCQKALETEQTLLRQTEEQTRSLRGLQQEICNLTHDHIDTSWEKLIEHLRLQRADAVKDYKRVTAAILAGNMVGQVLDEMRAAEDGRIQAGLDSGIVDAPLAAITRRYRRVQLDGDNLKVANDYEEFALADLSTGTQEQVLLALRIGLASYSAGEDRLFLILDDAFQHSDWERRVHLVDATIGLAQNGWQVFYFTMDDHIRDLFCEKARAALGNDFNYQELPRGRDWDALP